MPLNPYKQTGCLFIVTGSTIIGARLDTDIHINQCRLALHGTLVAALAAEDAKKLVVVTSPCVIFRPQLVICILVS